MVLAVDTRERRLLVSLTTLADVSKELAQELVFESKGPICIRL
jgi:hypothetical protein